MMQKPYRVLRIARWVLLGLAYVSGVASLTVAGFGALIIGGEPVTIFVDGPTIPARLLGLWNILVGAPLTFLFFYVPSAVIRLLLELRERLPASRE